MRTSIKTLEYLVNQINELTNSPLTPYSRTGEKFTGNIGNFHISQAYGGVCVHRMANTSGGVNTPIWQGHISKREAESQIRSFIRGLEMARA